MKHLTTNTFFRSSKDPTACGKIINYFDTTTYIHSVTCPECLDSELYATKYAEEIAEILIKGIKL